MSCVCPGQHASACCPSLGLEISFVPLTSYLCASLQSMVNTPWDTPVPETHGPSSGPSSQSCLCQPSPRVLASWLPLPRAPCSGSRSLHSPCRPLCRKLFFLLQAGFQTNPYSEPPPFCLQSLKPYFSP